MILLWNDDIRKELINDINKEKKSIVINMYVWSYDKVGITIIKALLKAAKRGVFIICYKCSFGQLSEKYEYIK